MLMTSLFASVSNKLSASLLRDDASVFRGVSASGAAEVATAAEVVEVVVTAEDVVAHVVMAAEAVGVAVLILLLKAAKEFVEFGVEVTFDLIAELNAGLKVEEILEVCGEDSQIDSRFLRDKRARFFTGLSRPFMLNQIYVYP